MLIFAILLVEGGVMCRGPSRMPYTLGDKNGGTQAVDWVQKENCSP